MNTLNRREFLATSGTAAALASIGAQAVQAQPSATPPSASSPTASPHTVGDDHRGPCIIGSANGIRSTAKAMELVQSGTYPLDAIVEGIKIVEDDPSDMSVGYGGLPNEDGIVELDASVMDGPLHLAGAVGALRNIKNPAAVALQVLRKTDHVMIVGEGALRFAKAMGFKEENLLTEDAKRAWEKWKADAKVGGHESKWLQEEQQIKAPSGLTKPKGHGRGGTAWPEGVVPYTTGTIHLSALTADGTMAACTSTSGLSWKIAGRLGDSPIVGAGMYCDNGIGSAGSTGRGESVIQVCGAFSVVQHMEAGLSPTEACLAVCKAIAERTREKRLLDESGRPKFDVTMYALRKDGAFGGASLWGGEGPKAVKFSVNDGKTNRHESCAFLYERKS
jgi:N4-(beta-N-acetylglucosaminyl)-L-asparaginase